MEHLSIDQLYTKEHDPLCRYCYAITKCQEDAEDACQEAFKKLMAQPGVVNQTQYLYRLAYTTSIGIIKQRQTECQLSPNCTETPEQDQPFDYECLHKAIRTLPARESMVIWMKYWDKLSSLEIGTKMGVSENAINMILFKAKKHLREIIGRIEAA